LQGHFTDLVSNAGKKKRNELQPGEVSVSSKKAMSSGSSVSTEVMVHP